MGWCDDPNQKTIIVKLPLIKIINIPMKNCLEMIINMIC